MKTGFKALQSLTKTANIHTHLTRKIHLKTLVNINKNFIFTSNEKYFAINNKKLILDTLTENICSKF